jgi:pyrimidine operon attenuation protein/uracil phosphoribosyltransferase
MTEKVIMDSEKIADTISRISDQILERNPVTDDMVFVGVRTRGIHIAHRLVQKLEKKLGKRIPIGTLDISLYRDDLKIKREWPELKKTDIPFAVRGKIVILVDDVIFTGRTSRAALEAIMDYGRPSSIQLAVLVDRGHRELPIQPDFVGDEIVTKKNDDVRVLLNEVDGRDEITVERN